MADNSPKATTTKTPECHNVFIFGAGVSADAGIPLLSNFVDTMYGYGVRRKTKEGEPLGNEDETIFDMANRIRKELESYHSRAFFDNRNIEDILSLLSFEALSGGVMAKRYDMMVSAVARTIELSCNVPFRATLPNELFNVADHYHRFWRTVLSERLCENLPAIGARDSILH